MGRKNMFHRKGGHQIIAATPADTGIDASVTLYGPPEFIMLSVDGSVKITTVMGDIVTLALLGKVQYRISPRLVWSTGSDAVTTWLMW